MRVLISSISLRLFVLVFATITTAFGAYAVVNLRSTSKNWDRTVSDGAQRFSDLIQSSTHYSMLQNRKEDVHHTIRSIAQDPDVESVRIYDKQGTIIFSADSEEIGQGVDMQVEACVSCHAQTTPLESVPVDSRVRIFTRAAGNRVLGLINPIENAPECAGSACHPSPAEQSVLGVLDVAMSMAEPDRRLAAVRRQSIVAAVLTALSAGLLSAAFIFRVVRLPVKKLITGTQSVANGRLDTEIPVRGGGEISQLGLAFNAMTQDLRRAHQEIRMWSGRLETRLQAKTDELSRTQRQVAHMDKMASLGRLAATVAHELNNPLAGVLNYAKLVERTLRESDWTDAEREELGRYLSLIQKETSRCGAIVRNLLIFARPSGATFAGHSLTAIMERSVMIVAHHMKMASVVLESVPLEGDDMLVCDADQIQQALVALLVNSVEAMPSGGTVRLAAEDRGDQVRITVADTGGGIPEEALPHVFEPFFSLNADADSPGLGLSVVYGIVQRHGAEIEVESVLGEGTTIHILLPRKPPSSGETDGGSDAETARTNLEKPEERIRG